MISKIRNHVIARVFRELNLIEQWGSGISRIYSEAKKQHLPEPEIIEIGMRIRFIIYLEQPITIESHSEVIRHNLISHKQMERFCLI